MQYIYTEQLLRDMETSNIDNVLPRVNNLLGGAGFKKRYAADEITLQVTQYKYLRATMFNITTADGEVKLMEYWQD